SRPGTFTSCWGWRGMPPGRRSRWPGGAGPGTSTPTRGRATRARRPGSAPWQVLGDPGRRAAYDQGLDPGRLPGRVRIAVRHSPATPGPGGAGSTASQAGAFGPPLVAGPVRVEGGSRPVPRARAWDEEDFRLALLAELVLRYRGRGRPW